jgi:hypothetical protein
MFSITQTQVLSHLIEEEFARRIFSALSVCYARGVALPAGIPHLPAICRVVCGGLCMPCGAAYCGAAEAGALRLLQDVRAGLVAADKANAVFQLTSVVGQSVYDNETTLPLSAL